MTDIDQLRQHCWIRAREAYGTSAIFQRRLAGKRRGLAIISFGGLALPLCVGALVLGFGAESPIVTSALPFAAALLVGQGLFALWAVINGWQAEVDEGVHSATENNRLSNLYKELASRAPADLDVQRGRLDVQYQVRTELDLRQGVSDIERRFGMRSALLQFEAPCAACGLTPTSMTPTACGVCGNFPKRLLS